MSPQHQPKGMPIDIESAKTLFGERYNPELNAYTRLIQTSPQKVAELGNAYAAFFQANLPQDLQGDDAALQGLFNWYATAEQDALFFKVVESLEDLQEFLEALLHKSV